MSSELPDIGSNRAKLQILGLPILESVEDLADNSRFSEEKIYQLLRRSCKQYKVYSIPKKSGGKRVIAQPSRELKALQAWILHTILRPARASAASVGFEQGESTRQNALPHVGSRVVMNLDVEDFFSSIHAGRVFYVFRLLGYSKWASSALARLCTFRDSLPQGSPASPKLANLVCLRLDRRIMGYVGRRGIVYTRYSDDLTFSSYSQAALVRSFRFIRFIVEDEGFRINRAKNRVSGPGRCRRATGLVIGELDVGIGRKQLRLLRSQINDLRGCSVEDVSESRIQFFQGWLAYVKSVDKKRYVYLVEYIRSLARRDPESAVRVLATGVANADEVDNTSHD